MKLVSTQAHREVFVVAFALSAVAQSSLLYTRSDNSVVQRRKVFISYKYMISVLYDIRQKGWAGKKI